MPIPLVLIVVVVVTALIGGGGIVVAVKWKDIIIALQGKKLAVLGARTVGKTNLISFLSTGSIPENYKQTVLPEKADAQRLQLKDLDLKLKDMLDLPGGEAAYAEWKEQHDQADVVLYLLRADKLIAKDGSAEARVRADLHHIGDWLEARSRRPRFFIIGTHCDLDPAFVALSADHIGDYVDKFRKLPIVSELVARGGGGHATKVILGSMKTTWETEALVYELFKQVVA